MNHLYVHIPFCRSRCAYCDFVSDPVRPHVRAGRVERYLEALRVELAGRLARVPDADSPGLADSGPSSRPLARGRGQFETVYVGGGTPTVLPEEALLDLVRDLAGSLRGLEAELTVEANPGTVDGRLLEGLRLTGATRFSLGVQSFSPRLRDTLGRRVTQNEIDEALQAIAGVDWGEWNLDLIFGIPGQTWSDAAADLEKALAAGPAHISLYDLTYTAGYEAHVGAACGPEARAEAAAWAEQHYSRAVETLEAAGYRRYEVSNFALPGHECRHNQAYWRGEDYLGIGVAAVSTMGSRRWTNPCSLEDYLVGTDPQVEILSPRAKLWEKTMLGLRTRDGVDETEVLPVLDGGARDRLLDGGFLERHCGKLRLNSGFLDISNAVISDLLVSPEEPTLIDAGRRWHSQNDRERSLTPSPSGT